MPEILNKMCFPGYIGFTDDDNVHMWQEASLLEIAKETGHAVVGSHSHSHRLSGVKERKGRSEPAEISHPRNLSDFSKTQFTAEKQDGHFLLVKPSEENNKR